MRDTRERSIGDAQKEMDSAARRFTLLGVAGLAYVAVTVAFSMVERPGLGIGHFYYVPVALAAFATGPVFGGVAGLFAAGLYNVALYLNPHLPSSLHGEQIGIRVLTFSAIGVLVGWFARRNRALVAELSALANRDSVTGLPNTRAFQTAIDERLRRAAPFALLIGDVDELRQFNAHGGRDEGDDALRRLADRLVMSKRAEDDVARVGGDEFAILATLGVEDGRTLTLAMEQQLNFGGDSVTFGWATFPHDSDNALGLYRAADERLYARKVARGFRRGPAPQTLPTSA
jgi:diguanylate cyclase (GGDEF)-like protein